MDQAIPFPPAIDRWRATGESSDAQSRQAELITSCPARSALTLETVGDEAAFLSMEASWNALAQAANLDHPFLTHQWVRSWWEAFGAGKSLHIIVVKAAGEIVGIAPLMLGTQKFFGVPLRTVEFIANDHCPRQDFLIASRTSEVVTAIWSRLLEQQHLWDVLLLRQLTADSPLAASLSALAAQRKYPCALWPSGDSPYLTIQGSWDDQFKRLGDKHRQNMRRRSKRLAEVGAVELERVTGGDALPSALEDGFRIEGVAWKDQNGTSIRSCPQTRAFYTSLARRFAQQGWLDLNFLTVGGRRIAFNYCVRYGNKIFLLKPGYDLEHANYSPVNLLCYLSLQEAFAAGVAKFDFLGLEDDWKKEWTRTKRVHNWMFVFSRSLRARLVYLAKFRLHAALQKRPAYRSLSSKLVKLRQSALIARNSIRRAKSR